MLDAFSVGQQVRVHFDLRGREYTRKRDGVTDWWVNLDCWRMEPLEEGAAPSAPEVSHSDTVSGGEFDDEIPF